MVYRPPWQKITLTPMLIKFNIQDDRSLRELLAKPLKKISIRITYTASRFSLLQCEMWSSV